MRTQFHPLIPDTQIYVGREDIKEKIIKEALTRRCVLLFGGRQSGKTTLLLKVMSDLSRRMTMDKLDSFTCPVYVDLTTLPSNAGTPDFFNLMVSSAISSCCKFIDGFDSTNFNKQSCNNIEIFTDRILEITKNTGNIDLTLLFLIDESERILGERFPRGFQDNLFAILYGAELAPKLNIGIVFTGAQQLFAFSEDDTSPIGSRASYVFLKNFKAEECHLYFNKLKTVFNIIIPEEMHQSIVVLTGGHPGTLSRTCHYFISEEINNTDAFENSLKTLKSDFKQLFRLWNSNLSNQSKMIHNKLFIKKQLSLNEVFDIFKLNKWDPVLAEKSIDELVFTGIATFDDNNLYICNQLYWDFMSRFLSDDAHSLTLANNDISNSLRDHTWKAIERAEIALRTCISQTYKEKFNTKVNEKIRLALGADSYNKIISNVKKSNDRYRYTKREAELDIFDGLYLTQLGQLMTWNVSWPYFSHLFKDKRELEGILTPIYAVRTDEAHFYDVPNRELERCKLHCEDLLFILEKNIGESSI